MKNTDKKWIWLKFILLIYLPFFYLCLLVSLHSGKAELAYIGVSLVMSLIGLIMTPAIFGLLPFAIIFVVADSIGLLKNSWKRIFFGSILGVSTYLLFYLIVGYNTLKTEGINAELSLEIVAMLFVHGLAVWSIYVLPRLARRLLAHLKNAQNP